jgi:hypothetical protein
MIDRFVDDTFRQKLKDPDDCTFMTVVIPGDIDPFERHYRFSVHVDAELRLMGLGCSVGGGTLYYEPDDEQDELEIAYCILDVDAVSVDGTRAALRQHLPELGAPDGTLVQFGDREDRFDGRQWHLDQPRSIEDPMSI